MVLNKLSKKDAGDIAVAKAICDLTEKNFKVFTAVTSEYLRFDLVAYKDNKFYKIQCKYSSDGMIRNKTTWANNSGSHINEYKIGDFDYYAIYLPDKNIVCYPSLNFGGKSLRTTLPNSAAPFYWYEDFLEFTDAAEKKTYKNFGYELTGTKGERISCRKVKRPSREELDKLLWEMPMTDIGKNFGVSDRAVAKWAKSYNLEKPKAGYWLKFPVTRT